MFNIKLLIGLVLIIGLFYFLDNNSFDSTFDAVANSSNQDYRTDAPQEAANNAPQEAANSAPQEAANNAPQEVTNNAFQEIANNIEPANSVELNASIDLDIDRRATTADANVVNAEAASAANVINADAAAANVGNNPNAANGINAGDNSNAANVANIANIIKAANAADTFNIAGVNIQDPAEQPVTPATPVNVSKNIPTEPVPQGAMNTMVNATIEPMTGGNNASINGSEQGSGSGMTGSSDASNGYSQSNNTQNAYPHAMSNSVASEIVNKIPEDATLADLQFDKSQLKDWFDTSVQQDFDNSYGDMFSLGVNTVGQSLKNASHDIRGIVPCPKINGVSPWGNSSIEPDYNITGLGCN